jgi:hypothetical protein
MRLDWRVPVLLYVVGSVIAIRDQLLMNQLLMIDTAELSAHYATEEMLDALDESVAEQEAEEAAELALIAERN